MKLPDTAEQRAARVYSRASAGMEIGHRRVRGKPQRADVQRLGQRDGDALQIIKITAAVEAEHELLFFLGKPVGGGIGVGLGVDRRVLEQRAGGYAAAAVVGQCAQQRADRGRAHHGRVVAQRVQQPDAVAQRVVRRQRELVVHLRRNERVGVGLKETQTRHSGVEPRAVFLVGRFRRPRSRGRRSGWRESCRTRTGARPPRQCRRC